jgi:hypothetical protein
MSTLRLLGINAGACSGLTLSGALYIALKGRAWLRRMGQSFLNYMEFRTNHEPYMVHGKFQKLFLFGICLPALPTAGR